MDLVFALHEPGRIGFVRSFFKQEGRTTSTASRQLC
jgi:hypothetical protein